MTPLSARDFALRELDAKRLPGWPAGAIRKGRPSDPPADPRDLALAEHITVGVVKNVLLLQHLIQHYSGRNLKSVEPLVQKILAVGLYQLRLLTRIPASAAVDEAVEQARRFGQTRASGFVNAILRKATREPSPPLPGRDNPQEYARVVLSHPPEVFAKLQRLLGAADAIRFCEHDQSEPPVVVRLAPGLEARALCEARDVDPGVSITAHEQAGMFVVAGARRARFADWAGRGIAQVQDPTAATVVPRADIRRGQSVLDRCCGLGTKTIQMRLAAGESGRVVAMDPAAARCEGLRRLIEARGFANVAVACSAWLRETPAAGEMFDRAVADVPCSNSGVFARRPEARYHQAAGSLASLATLQDQILDDTAPAIKLGGLLVYSTCSVWPEENRERVDAFLSRHAEFELSDDHVTWPSFESDPARYRDGGYVAVLRRK